MDVLPFLRSLWRINVHTYEGTTVLDPYALSISPRGRGRCCPDDISTSRIIGARGSIYHELCSFASDPFHACGAGAARAAYEKTGSCIIPPRGSTAQRPIVRSRSNAHGRIRKLIPVAPAYYTIKSACQCSRDATSPLLSVLLGEEKLLPSSPLSALRRHSKITLAKNVNVRNERALSMRSWHTEFRRKGDRVPSADSLRDIIFMMIESIYFVL